MNTESSDEDQHPVQPDADAAGADLAELHVHERHRAAAAA